jgi:hypothetical protein
MFSKMKELRENIEISEQMNQKLKSELQQVNASYESYKQSTWDYKEVVAEKTRALMENSMLQTALEVKTEKLAAESASLEEAREEILNLKKQNAGLTAQVTRSQVQIDDLNVSVAKITKIFENSEARGNKLQTYLDELRKDFEKLEIEKNTIAQDAEMQNERNAREVEKLENRTETMKSTMDRLNKDLRSEKERSEFLKSQLDSDNAANNKVSVQLEDALIEIDRLKAQIDETRSGNDMYGMMSSVAPSSQFGGNNSRRQSNGTENDSPMEQSSSSQSRANASRSAVAKPKARLVLVTRDIMDVNPLLPEHVQHAPSADNSANQPDDHSIMIAEKALNDTPHPERLVKPFFSSFNSDDANLVKEGDEDDFEHEGDMESEQMNSAREEEGTFIPPNTLPERAAEQRRKSEVAAMYMRSQSISEEPPEDALKNAVPNTANIFVRRKKPTRMVKKKVVEVITVKRMVKKLRPKVVQGGAPSNGNQEVVNQLLAPVGGEVSLGEEAAVKKESEGGGGGGGASEFLAPAAAAETTVVVGAPKESSVVTSEVIPPKDPELRDKTALAPSNVEGHIEYEEYEEEIEVQEERVVDIEVEEVIDDPDDAEDEDVFSDEGKPSLSNDAPPSSSSSSSTAAVRVAAPPRTAGADRNQQQHSSTQQSPTKQSGAAPSTIVAMPARRVYVALPKTHHGGDSSSGGAGTVRVALNLPTNRSSAAPTQAALLESGLFTESK